MTNLEQLGETNNDDDSDFEDIEENEAAEFVEKV